MRKLLSANFARLKKNKAFWFTIAVVFLLSFISILNGARSAKVMVENDFVVTLENYYFNQAPFMGLFSLIFVSLFLGTEYSDGTIRNKLMVGHTRENIYLSNFIVCFTANIVFVAVWLIGGIPGFFLIEPISMGLGGYLIHFCIILGFTASFAALFTLIGSLSSNKALTVIFSLIVWLILLFSASAFYDRLCSPETLGGMAYIDCEFKMIDPTPNPLYLTGIVRLICECILDFLPTGQSILLADMVIEHPVRQIIFSVLFTVMALTIGSMAFRRKDIK